MRSTALKTAGIYAAVSVAWILLSDRAVAWLAPDSETLVRLQRWKGLFFVLFTAALLFWYVQRGVRELVRSRQEIAAREVYFRQLFEKAPSAYQSLHESGRLIDVNEAWLEMLGYRTREEILDRPMTDFLASRGSDPFEKRFDLLKSTGRIQDVEIELQRADGRTITVSLTGRVQRDAEGRFLCTHCVLHDITARKAADSALRESERRLALALDGARLGTFEHDLVHGTVRWNERQAELFGLRLSEFGGTVDDARSRIHPDDLPRLEERLQLARQDRRMDLVEFRVVHPDGTVRWIGSAGRYLRDDDGRPVSLSGVSMDIDSRKRAEIERDRLFEHSVELLSVADLSGCLLQVNPAWTRVLGWSRDELTATPALEFVHPDDREATRGILERLAGGDSVHEFVNRFRHRDGSYRALSWNTFAFLEEGVLLGVARDVTAHRDLEEQLRQAQKMEAVGQLAGGVAHDFNNILQVINGYAELALDRLDTDDPERRCVAEIAVAGARAARLVSQLLAFSRRQVLEPVDLDLNTVIDGLLGLAERTLGEHIRLVWSPGSGLGTVTADRGQLEQVLLNLWINARDAMPEGGALRIETSDAVFAEDQCRHSPWARPGRYARLSVRDSGSGMDPETLERIWEPFFTTKPVGKGTGLGLSTVYGIVRQHDGLIHVESDPGVGTTFDLYFPVSTSAVAPVTGPGAAASTVGGGETVLVAEDNDAVRGYVTMVLEGEGYRVVAVPDGGAALEYLQAHGRTVDVALLDMVMPNLGGREVYDRVKDSLPGLSFLFTSGYSLDGIHTDLVLDDGFELVQKPFETTELLQRIRAALARG